jgi:hypothetical protein
MHLHHHTNTHAHTCITFIQQKVPVQKDTFNFPVWEAKVFEVQLLGMSEALGFAIGSGCVDYLAAGVAACVVLFAPLLAITYILHRGVTKHARFVPAEGSILQRFMGCWRENKEKRAKTFLCFPYGSVLVFFEAFGCANERGEWEELEDENDGKDPDQPSFLKNPWSKFVKRFGPMFQDYTSGAW